MTQRLSISISDELFDRLQKVKDKIMVSKICQNAILNSVEIEEMKNTQEVENLIESLKLEKAAIYKEYKDLGFKDGSSDAYSMKYKDFLFFNDWDSRQENSQAPFEYFASEHSSNRLKEIESGYLAIGDIGLESPEVIVDCIYEYLGGWHEGVKHIWEQVKNKV